MNKQTITIIILLILFLLAAGLALLPVPSVFIAFLLATVAASFIYYLLGGITAQNTLRLSPNDKLVAQIGGSAAVFILSFLLFRYYIDLDRQNVMTIKPNPNTFIVLSEHGEVLKLSQITPYQFVGKPIPTRSNVQNLSLVPIIDGGDIFIKPEGANDNNLIGRLFGGSDQGDPTYFFEKLRQDNYYHPLLDALRRNNCDGQICTDKVGAGFPIIAIADPKRETGKLIVISAPQSIADDLLKEAEKATNKTLHLKLSKSSNDLKQIELQLKINNIKIENLNSLPKAYISKEVYTKFFNNKERQRGYLSFVDPT